MQRCGWVGSEPEHSPTLCLAGKRATSHLRDGFSQQTACHGVPLSLTLSQHLPESVAPRLIHCQVGRRTSPAPPWGKKSSLPPLADRTLLSTIVHPFIGV